ncbi:hypothetical protein BDR03DRAFT_326645 [Suillus americanus]|nr:hypothetical protein BDR03DRAFT_326645 [Suillus americanus]
MTISDPDNLAPTHSAHSYTPTTVTLLPFSFFFSTTLHYLRYSNRTQPSHSDSSTCIILNTCQGPSYHELHSNGPANWKTCTYKTAGRNGGRVEVIPPSGHLRNRRRGGRHRCPP